MRFDVDRVRQEILNLLVSYPELAEDELLRADMIEGATSAHDFLRIVEQRRQEATSMAGAIASNIAELGLRQERFERRERAMRQLMFKVMETADLKKIELPEATITMRAGSPQVVIIDHRLLPDDLVRVKREPDKQEIRKRLMEGEALNGAYLSNGFPSVSIRTK